MDKSLQILIVEDSEWDAELMCRELARHGMTFAARRVDTRDSYLSALEERMPDIVLSDFSMPGSFDGFVALELLRERDAHIPFVFVSGTIGEDRAVESLRRGATDYVLKEKLDRLAPVVRRALHEAREREALHRAQEALRESEERFRLFMEHLPGRASIRDREGRYQFVNSFWLRAFGRTAADVLGRNFEDILPAERVESLRHFHLETLISKKPLTRTFRTGDDGHFKFWLSTHFPIPDARGETAMVGTVAIDITERKIQEEKIARLSRIRSVLGEINAAIVRIRDRQALLDEACRIAAEAGRFPFVWIGNYIRPEKQVRPVAWAGTVDAYRDTVRDPRPVDDAAPSGSGAVAIAVLSGKAVIVNDVENDPLVVRRQLHLDRGTHSLAVLPLFVSDQIAGVLVLYAKETGFFDDEEMELLRELSSDIGFALETIEKQEKLDFLSYYDVLTGLPNRALFIDRVGQQMRSRAGEQSLMVLALINLDRFRNVNESLGRKGGDELLKLVARRLEIVFQGKDSVARIGADGFGMVMCDILDAEAVVHSVENNVLSCFQEPFSLQGNELRVSAKAGIAMFPADGEDADTLYKNAEAALKKTRESGERYLFYSYDMNARAAQMLSLETRLRRAVEAREFVLHYQPKINLSSGKICGMEALIRWNEPDVGLVAPGTFIPMLEETGLILEVGRWALHRALADHREWTARGCAAPRIAVNVSAIQLQQKNFTDMVIGSIRDEGDNPDALELEVTESLLMKDVETIIRKLSILRGLGVHIALDDFGTGYSSLSYLARLPISSIKIDRSFVAEVGGNPQDMAIVTTMIALAHSLNLKVIAEGVETPEQAKLLRLLNCEEAQGYYFSKPVPAAEIESLLLEHSAPATPRSS